MRSDVYGRIILKGNVEEWLVNFWTGFRWLTVSFQWRSLVNTAMKLPVERVTVCFQAVG